MNKIKDKDKDKDKDNKNGKDSVKQENEFDSKLSRQANVKGESEYNKNCTLESTKLNTNLKHEGCSYFVMQK